MTTLRDALAREIGRVEMGHESGCDTCNRKADDILAALRSDPEVLTAFAEALEFLSPFEVVGPVTAEQAATALLDHLLGSTQPYYCGGAQNGQPKPHNACNCTILGSTQP